jgi:hypothetical protein
MIMQRFLATSFSFGHSDQTHPQFHTVCGLLALIGITGFLMAAADPPNQKDNANRQDAARNRDRNAAESVVVPQSVQKLNLTESQRSQIDQICREYDQSIDAVWNQFHDRYMQTIRLETSMLSAIEDQLSDDQRQSIREHRRKTARHERATARTTEKPNPGEQVKNDAAADRAKDKAAGEVDIEAPIGVALSRDQEGVVDSIHLKYRPHLRSMNREIHHLHNRLLSLETEKMAEIEHVLTKDQLKQLRSDRANAPDTTKITLSGNSATKTD